jgi:hypothetical protein
VNRAVRLYCPSQPLKTGIDSEFWSNWKTAAAAAEFSAAFKPFAGQILDKRRQHDELASAAIIQQSFLPKPRTWRQSRCS